MSDGLFELSKSLTRFGGTMTRLGALSADIVKRQREATYKQEYNNALVSLNEASSDFVKSNVLQYNEELDEDNNQALYWQKLPEYFDRKIKETWDELQETFTTEEAREAAELYYRDFVSTQGLKIAQAAYEQDKGLKRVDYGAQLQSAINLGDLELVEQITEDADPTIVSPGEAKEDQLRAIYEINKNSLLDSLLTMGPDEGIKWLENATDEQLSWKDFDGNVQTLIDKDKNDLLNELELVSARAVEAQRQEHLNQWLKASDLAHQGILSYEMLRSKDFSLLQNEKDIKYFKGILKKQAEGKSPYEVTDEAIKSEVNRRLRDEKYTRWEIKEYINEKEGYGLSTDDAERLRGKADKKIEPEENTVLAIYKDALKQDVIDNVEYDRLINMFSDKLETGEYRDEKILQLGRSLLDYDWGMKEGVNTINQFYEIKKKDEEDPEKIREIETERTTSLNEYKSIMQRQAYTPEEKIKVAKNLITGLPKYDVGAGKVMDVLGTILTLGLYKIAGGQAYENIEEWYAKQVEEGRLLGMELTPETVEQVQGGFEQKFRQAYKNRKIKSVGVEPKTKQIIITDSADVMFIFRGGRWHYWDPQKKTWAQGKE